MMGPAKYAAWKAGAFDLKDLVGRTREPRWGTMRVERSLTDIPGADEANRWRKQALTRAIKPISGGSPELSLREQVSHLLREGKLSAEQLRRIEQVWHERLSSGVRMPNGELVQVSLDDVYHVLVDGRIRRKPERNERLLASVFEIRQARGDRRRVLSRWEEEGGNLVAGFAILLPDGHMWTMHVTTERSLEPYRSKEQLLWPE